MNQRLHDRDAKLRFAMYVRNFIFGVEDSLVSTVGLLSGIAVGGVPTSSLILTGIVLIFVEAFSMGAGSFLSEEEAEEYVDHEKAALRPSFNGALIMFLSYFIAGFVPLAPYVFLPAATAFWTSIIFSLIALFLLGIACAKVCKVGVWRNSLRMFAIGGFAIVVGIIVGALVR